MNRGIKAIGIILSLLLLIVLVMMALISAVYLQLPIGIRGVGFLRNSLTNTIFNQLLFWIAIVFAVVLLIVIFVLIFYPKTKQTFVLQEDHGRLVLDKKAIEGFVRSKLASVDFVSTPKVKVRATKNKIKVYVAGQLARTSMLVDKTGTLVEEIRSELQSILGSEAQVKVEVKYDGYEENNETKNHSRVE